MHLDKWAYEPTLLRGDILYCFQGLINKLKKIDKLRTGSFYSVVPGDKDFKDQSLQPEYFVYWKRNQIKDSLQSYLKGTLLGVTNGQLKNFSNCREYL